MTKANLSQAGTLGIPPALRRALAAILLPEVRAMLQRLAEFDLGIFTPHRHDERTGDSKPLPENVLQAVAGCKVSFKSAQEVGDQANRFPPGGLALAAGASVPASVCEMVVPEELDDPERPVKHKMPDEH